MLASLWATAALDVMVQADLPTDGSQRSVIILGSIALIIVAVFITFLGYKHFSTALVLQGAILGSYVGWYIGLAFGESSENKSVLTSLAVAIALGLFLGVLTCCMKGFMRFLFGVALGVQLGSVLNILWLHTLESSINNSNPNNFGYIAMVAAGLVFGLLAYFSGRKGHILLTAWVGAYWIIQAIGNFAGNFPSLFYPFPRGNLSATVSSSFYFYLGGWVLLATLGTITQLQMTTYDSNFHEMVNDDEDDLSLEKEFHRSKTPYLEEVSV
ncbi:hypothetical protein LEN26_005781 [Aphanomyces euteiches]|nr:hypothetical protein AeMF1_000171 [Aphanomyces euteiches]KAH9137364.1 hypothetical protein LEN26_005781 [Aphanomyces euteiches]KAH9195741.1 hypothetical protein AeNC1_002282 [Aphanomyces euteiches]